MAVAFRVLTVTEGDTVDPTGNPTASYQITFTIEGRPGSFTVTVPKDDPNPVATAAAKLAAEAGIVDQIYSLT